MRECPICKKLLPSNAAHNREACGTAKTNGTCAYKLHLKKRKSSQAVKNKLESYKSLRKDVKVKTKYIPYSRDFVVDDWLFY